MCLVPMKIKSVSPSGQKYSFVPCGKCAECRKSYQSQWFFRLAAELEMAKRRNWHIGFFTLTYNDEHLPWAHFDDCSHDSVMCFRRSDVRRLILRLRKKYHKEEGVVGLRYLIASEFGEHTHRPHYHGVIAFPPSISPDDMLNSIEHFWSTSDDDNMQSLGFVFPSEKVYASEKFLCKSAYGAAAYAAKYCCKDLDYENYLDGARDFPTSVDVRDMKSFHIQSRSLGFELIRNMSDEQKYELFTQGLQLVGSSRPLPIPLYIRNKIFFSPDYQYDDAGNRIVRRMATSFVKKYAAEIWSKKVDFYQSYFTQCMTLDFWNSLGLSDDMALTAYNSSLSIREYFGGLESMSVYFVSYFGVPPYARERDPIKSWLSRYEKCWFEDKLSYERTDDDICLDFLLSTIRYQNKEKAYEKMNLLNKILDFHHNLNKGV